MSAPSRAMASEAYSDQAVGCLRPEPLVWGQEIGGSTAPSDQALSRPPASSSVELAGNGLTSGPPGAQRRRGWPEGRPSRALGHRQNSFPNRLGEIEPHREPNLVGTQRIEEGAVAPLLSARARVSISQALSGNCS